MIPLEDARIRLSHHRRDSAHSQDGDIALERIDAIDGSIQLVGDLDEAQRRRLLQIAGRCWMHRTLSAGVDIRFHLDETPHVDSQRQILLEQKLAV